MTQPLTRRQLLAAGGTALLAAGRPAVGQDAADDASPFKLALNTSTIRPLSLDEKVQVVADAGYDGIELWINELDDYANQGKSLDDLGTRLEDLGLKVPNIIGLWNCMPPEDEKREDALREVRRKIEQAEKVKAEHIAAVCTPDRADIDVLWAADRYREIMAIGEQYGVIPGVEFIGSLRGIHTLAQAAAVAIHANHPKACIIADTFHLYRGGSGFDGVRRLSGDAIAVCHFNDVPADPPQSELRDSDRIYPGDGILPLVQLIKDLRAIGFRGWLSLELFKRDYWQKPPLENAGTGLAKMKAVIEAARA